MTKLEQAYHLIENLQFADFFEFMENHAVSSKETITHLKNTIVWEGANASYCERLKVLANKLLHESEKKYTSKKGEADNAPININQFGEKSLYIENNNGNININ
jgi:hypothetical protein